VGSRDPKKASDDKSFQQKYEEALAKFAEDGKVHDFDAVIFYDVLDFIQMKLNSITNSTEKDTQKWAY
jgi:hypothetical protein